MVAAVVSVLIDHINAFIITPTSPATIVRKLDVSDVAIDLDLHGVGGWECTVHNDPELLQTLRERTTAFWVLFKDTRTGEYYGGPLRRIRRRGNTNGTQDVTLAGPGPAFLIEKRRALPDPTTRTYGTTPHDVADIRTGVGSEVIRGYIDDNAGPSAITERQEPVQLTPLALSIGGTVTGRAQFHPLFTFCCRLAEDAGLILDVGMLPSARGVMSVRVPVVRDIEWSERRNEIPPGWELEERAAMADYFYIGGTVPVEVVLDGSGDPTGATVLHPEDRIIASYGDPPKPEWGLQVETYIDRPNVESAVTLSDEGYQAHFDHTAFRNVSVGTLDTPDGYLFGVDYLLGDIGTVEIGGGTYAQVITRVMLRYSKRRRQEMVELGEPNIVGLTLGLVAGSAPPAPSGGAPPTVGDAYFSAGTASTPSAEGVSATLFCPITSTVPAGSQMRIERRPVGGGWVDDPGSTVYVFTGPTPTEPTSTRGGGP